MKRKRHKIILEDDMWKYKNVKKHEVFTCDMNICSYLRNKYLVIVWSHDSNQKEPHIHIIDSETFGNKINCAYSIITGKPIKLHGSMIQEKLSDIVLSVVNRMIKYQNREKNIIYFWNCFNKQQTRIKKIHKLSN